MKETTVTCLKHLGQKIPASLVVCSQCIQEKDHCINNTSPFKRIKIKSSLHSFPVLQLIAIVSTSVQLTFLRICERSAGRKRAIRTSKNTVGHL
jgi:hypothetical protein